MDDRTGYIRAGFYFELRDIFILIGIFILIYIAHYVGCIAKSLAAISH